MHFVKLPLIFDPRHDAIPGYIQVDKIKYFCETSKNFTRIVLSDNDENENNIVSVKMHIDDLIDYLKNHSVELAY